MDIRLEITGAKNISEYWEYLTNNISSYIVQFLDLEDDAVKKNRSIKYFLENDTWHIDELMKFDFLKSQCENYKYNNTISFNSTNSCLKLEVKYVVLKKILSTEWGIESLFNKNKYIINNIFKFTEENYPGLDSIIDLDIDTASQYWTSWLESKSIKTISSNYVKWLGKECVYTNGKGNFLKNIYDGLLRAVDNREEWYKDKWDVRNLKQDGVLYNISQGKYFIDFSKVRSRQIKDTLKEYYKERLTSGEKATWITIINTHRYVLKFICYLQDIEPSWDDLRKLTREHINQYLNFIDVYSKNELNHNLANSSKYISKSLAYTKKFLTDIYNKEYKIAPEIDIKKLTLYLDKPKIVIDEFKEVDYIPNFVLEQFIMQFDNLHKDIQPIAYIMLMTGLGISDALCIKQDCLLNLEGVYFLQVKQQWHDKDLCKIPIDLNLTSIIKQAIDDSKTVSTKENNPDNYIFSRYKGKRKGKPYNSAWVLNQFNKFAQENKIANESGGIFHFKSQQFKHTYFINLLDKEMDILKLKDLPSKTSASMTMRYIFTLNNRINME